MSGRSPRRRRQRLGLDTGLLRPLTGRLRVLLSIALRWLLLSVALRRWRLPIAWRWWRILLPIARRRRLSRKSIIGHVGRRPRWLLVAKKIAELSSGGFYRDRRAGQGQNNGNADHGTLGLDAR